MESPFFNISVKCDNWAQMLQLSKVAETYGYNPFCFLEKDFHTGDNIFGVDQSDNSYANINEGELLADEVVIPFSEFVFPAPGLSWPEVLTEAHEYAMKRPKKTKYRVYRDEYLEKHFVITRIASGK